MATYSADMADSVQTLPLSQSPLSPSETAILDTLFPAKYSMWQQIFLGTKDVVAVAMLFALMSLPGIDDLVQKFVPVTKDAPYLIIIVKSVLFALGYFIIKNSNLIRSR